MKWLEITFGFQLLETVHRLSQSLLLKSSLKYILPETTVAAASTDAKIEYTGAISGAIPKNNLKEKFKWRYKNEIILQMSIIGS